MFKTVTSGTKAQDAKAVLEDTRQELVNHTRAPGWSDADLVRIDLQIAHVDKTILELDLDDIADPPHWTKEEEKEFREKLRDAESENAKIRAVVSVITDLESYTAAAETYVREAVDLLKG
jgi:hypothetical protein